MNVNDTALGLNSDQGLTLLELLFTLSLLGIFSVLSVKTLREIHKYWQHSSSDIEQSLSHSEAQAGAAHHIIPSLPHRIHCTERRTHPLGFELETCELISTPPKDSILSQRILKTSFNRIVF